MIGMRVRGKKPVAGLILLFVGLIYGEYIATDIYQQIYYSLIFIGSTLWLAVIVWFLDSQQNQIENNVIEPEPKSSEREEWFVDHRQN